MILMVWSKFEAAVAEVVPVIKNVKAPTPLVRLQKRVVVAVRLLRHCKCKCRSINGARWFERVISSHSASHCNNLERLCSSIDSQCYLIKGCHYYGYACSCSIRATIVANQWICRGAITKNVAVALIAIGCWVHNESLELV
jgi:hypothetical protein